MNLLVEQPYIQRIIAVIKNSMLQTHRKIRVNGRKSDAFVYVLSGSCAYTTEKGSFTVRENQVLYLSNQAVYTMELQTDNYEFIYVDFLAEEREERYDCFVLSVGNEVESAFYKLYRAYRRGEMENHLTCMRYLYGIYEQLRKSSASVYLQGTLRDKIAEVKEYIEEHYGDTALSVASLSERFGMSEVYLRKTFRAVYKTSPKKYMVSIRLKKAINWMQYSFLSLEECAKLCGFSCVQYFNKAFKDATGETPAVYRRRIYKE